MIQAPYTGTPFEGLKPDDFHKIVNNRKPDFTVVDGPNITGQGRWSTYYDAVVKHGDRFFRADWSTGSTEYQEQDPDFEIVEVFPHEKTVTVYEPKGN